MKQTLKGPVVALVLAIGAAGAVTITSGVATAPQAQAFGFGDVWKGAKKVGSAAKKGAKAAIKAGKKVQSIQQDAERFGRKVAYDAAGKIFAKVGRETAKVGFSVASKLGGPKIDKSEYDRAERIIGGFIKRIPGRVDSVVDRAKGAVKNEIKDIGRRLVNGKYERVGIAKPVTPHPGWDRPVGSQQWIGRAPVRGVTKQGAGKGVKTTVVRDRSVWGRPVTTPKKIIGNDRSIWGRPVGVGQKVVGQDRSAAGRPVGVTRQKLKSNGRRKAKRLSREVRLPNPGRTVQGITKENLKPARKADGFATKDVKFKRGNGRKRFESNRSRRRDAERRDNRRDLRRDRRSNRKVEMRRKGGSRKNRRGRRG